MNTFFSLYFFYLYDLLITRLVDFRCFTICPLSTFVLLSTLSEDIFLALLISGLPDYQGQHFGSRG